MITINERNVRSLTVSFTDKNGDPVTPSTFKYRIDDILSGTVIKDTSTVTPSSSSHELIITAEENRILNSANLYEQRRVSTEWYSGLSPVGAVDYIYQILNLYKMPMDSSIASVLILETGDGIENANTYISLIDANLYFNARYESGWNVIERQREAALIKATQYIDRKYINRWPGIKMTADQSLQWPRMWAEDVNGYSVTGIPVELKDAVCEAALVSLTTSLNPSQSAPIKRKNIAGAIEIEYFTSNAVTTKYPLIEQLLNTLLTSGNDVVRG